MCSSGRNAGETKAKVVPSVYFVRGRTATMHADVPYPKNGWHGLVCTFSNMFVQAMDVNRLHETLRGLDLVVVVDHQMTETVRWADVVLPATTWYEKTDLTATPPHPFLQLQQAAIDPVGGARSALWRGRAVGAGAGGPSRRPRCRAAYAVRSSCSWMIRRA